MFVGFPFAVLLLIVGGVLWARTRETWKRARLLKRAGFTLMAFTTAFFGLFIIGEAFSDPGGWKAAGLVSAWLFPLVAVAALAWLRPGWASWLFGALISLVIGMSVWFALDPDGWRRFEDRNGPVRDVIVFALAAAIALLGLKRTAVAGWMLVLLGVVPIAISSLGSHLGWVSLSVVSSPTLIAGVLYLASAAMAARSTHPGTERSGSKGLPEAA
jgi:hypothetical protein